MAVAGVISAAALALGPTARAVKADPAPPCPGGEVCDYDEPNFQETGPYGGESGLPVHSGDCLPTLVGGGYVSIINNTNLYQRAWENSNCTGRSVVIYPTGRNGNIGFHAYGRGGY
jgi:hypothetical protein